MTRCAEILDSLVILAKNLRLAWKSERVLGGGALSLAGRRIAGLRCENHPLARQMLWGGTAASVCCRPPGHTRMRLGSVPCISPAECPHVSLKRAVQRRLPAPPNPGSQTVSSTRQQEAHLVYHVRWSLLEPGGELSFAHHTGNKPRHQSCAVRVLECLVGAREGRCLWRAHEVVTAAVAVRRATWPCGHPRADGGS